MKRSLVGSTCLVSVTLLSAPAFSQEWDLDVHGFFDQHVGYASNDIDAGDLAVLNNGYVEDGDYDEVVLFTNAEIHFTPSIELENGLTFGVNVQLEANNNMGDDIDESYMFIKGDRFGKLVLGSTNSAGYKMMIGAPEVTSMPLQSPSVSAYVPFSAVYDGGLRTAGLSYNTEVSGNNDAQRITYYTPSFNGFMLGASYAPTGTWTNGQVLNGGARNNYIFNRDTSLNDIFDVAASYEQSFNNFDINVAARYGTGNWGNQADNDGRDNPETWALGAQFGYLGFTLGGAYAESDSGLNGSMGDSTGWSLGLAYETQFGWSFGAQTYQGKYDTGLDSSLANKQKYEAYQIGASREIGPGIDFDIYGNYVKADNGYKSHTDRDADIEGWGVGTALNLSF